MFEFLRDFSCLFKGISDSEPISQSDFELKNFVVITITDIIVILLKRHYFRPTSWLREGMPGVDNA